MFRSYATLDWLVLSWKFQLDVATTSALVKCPHSFSHFFEIIIFSWSLIIVEVRPLRILRASLDFVLNALEILMFIKCCTLAILFLLYFFVKALLQTGAAWDSNGRIAPVYLYIVLRAPYVDPHSSFTDFKIALINFMQLSAIYYKWSLKLNFVSISIPRYLNFETSSICLLFRNMMILVRLFLVIIMAVDLCSLNLILFLGAQFVISYILEFDEFSSSKMVFPLSWLSGHLQMKSLLCDDCIPKCCKEL